VHLVGISRVSLSARFLHSLSLTRTCDHAPSAALHMCRSLAVGQGVWIGECSRRYSSPSSLSYVSPLPLSASFPSSLLPPHQRLPQTRAHTVDACTLARADGVQRPAPTHEEEEDDDDEEEEDDEDDDEDDDDDEGENKKRKEFDTADEPPARDSPAIAAAKRNRCACVRACVRAHWHIGVLLAQVAICGHIHTPL